MATNTGKFSEQEFVRKMTEAYGKNVYIHRYLDTNEIKGMTGSGFVASNPSDYTVTLNGLMEYAEVKSISNKTTSFSFSHFTKAQVAGMKQQIAAHGAYNIYLHVLETNQWYKFSAGLVERIKGNGKKSVTLKELENYKWVLPSTRT